MDKQLIKWNVPNFGPDELEDTTTLIVDNTYCYKNYFPTPKMLMIFMDTADVIITEQTRMILNNNGNTRQEMVSVPTDLETSFLIEETAFWDAEKLEICLINYKNKLGIFVFRAKDPQTNMIKTVPLNFFADGQDLKFLIHLFNQDNIYYHIWTMYDYTKTRARKNPFKSHKTIKKILYSIDDKVISERNPDKEELKKTYDEFLEIYTKEKLDAIMDKNIALKYIEK